ncbi:MAG: hypothetical protein JXC32_02125, partial [Anaerolineae bacterium]|nr:hypothetical protein [Anaerolineae bacterium]
MTQWRVSALAILVLVAFCLTACAGELGGTTAADPVAAPQEGWTLLVRSDGPRWLGPAWWRAQGVDPDSL